MRGKGRLCSVFQYDASKCICLHKDIMRMEQAGTFWRIVPKKRQKKKYFCKKIVEKFE